MFSVCHPKILHKHCFQFLLGPFSLPRETEDNAYAKFWGDKQRTLWYVMVFSGVVNCDLTNDVENDCWLGEKMTFVFNPLLLLNGIYLFSTFIT